MRLHTILSLGYLTTLLTITGCGTKFDEKAEAGTASPSAAKRTNLTILLDLSNRINAKYGQDNQQNRDVAIIKSAATWFKERLKKQGAIKDKDRFAVYFEPQPQQDASLDQVARSLQFDLGKPGMKPADRKLVYNNIDKQTASSVQRLYEYVRQQSYDGADVWGFAKEKMAARCIMDTAQYRNVLIVVTDGYLDHVRNRGMRDGNKAAYFNDRSIEQDLVKKANFTSANWAGKYDAGKYGLLVPTGTNLKGLEVLILEINTYNRPPFYADVVKRYVTDWFKAMGVKHVEAQQTSIPSDTEQSMLNFLK